MPLKIRSAASNHEWRRSTGRTPSAYSRPGSYGKNCSVSRQLSLWQHSCFDRRGDAASLRAGADWPGPDEGHPARGAVAPESGRPGAARDWALSAWSASMDEWRSPAGPVGSRPWPWVFPVRPPSPCSGSCPSARCSPSAAPACSSPSRGWLVGPARPRHRSAARACRGWDGWRRAWPGSFSLCSMTRSRRSATSQIPSSRTLQCAQRPPWPGFSPLLGCWDVPATVLSNHERENCERHRPGCSARYRPGPGVVRTPRTGPSHRGASGRLGDAHHPGAGHGADGLGVARCALPRAVIERLAAPLKASDLSPDRVSHSGPLCAGLEPAIREIGLIVSTSAIASGCLPGAGPSGRLMVGRSPGFRSW